MEKSPQAVEIKKRVVFFDNDGAVDDLISLTMLLAMKNVELIGIAITPADCFFDPSAECQLKLLSLFGKTDVQIAKAKFPGENQFPSAWRADCNVMANLPHTVCQAFDKSLLTKESGPDFMIRKIKESKEKVTVVMTGPCCNVAAALEKDPSIKDNIEELLIMGGAIDCKGNVERFDHDGSAEWNFYYDPEAARKVIHSGLRIVLFTLDAINNCPLRKEFYSDLAKHKKYSAAYYIGCSTTLFGIHVSDTMYMWDPVTTSYLGCEGLCKLVEREIDVELENPSQGNTVEKKGSGCVIQFPVEMNRDKFEAYFIDLFKFDFPNQKDQE